MIKGLKGDLLLKRVIKMENKGKGWLNLYLYVFAFIDLFSLIFWFIYSLQIANSANYVNPTGPWTWTRSYRGQLTTEH